MNDVRKGTLHDLELHDAGLPLRRAVYSQPDGTAFLLAQHRGQIPIPAICRLLEKSYFKSRRVDHYAQQLHVTPKYLSTTCKRRCRETASQLIDAYVLKDIEYLLKHSMKSVKEIAFELDFPNLSFFGKYVKQHFGMSPKAYREQAMKEK